jgi:hypothetical protein
MAWYLVKHRDNFTFILPYYELLKQMMNRQSRFPLLKAWNETSRREIGRLKEPIDFYLCGVQCQPFRMRTADNPTRPPVALWYDIVDS